MHFPPALHSCFSWTAKDPKMFSKKLRILCYCFFLFFFCKLMSEAQKNESLIVWNWAISLATLFFLSRGCPFFLSPFFPLYSCPFSPLYFYILPIFVSCSPFSCAFFYIRETLNFTRRSMMAPLHSAAPLPRIFGWRQNFAPHSRFGISSPTVSGICLLPPNPHHDPFFVRPVLRNLVNSLCITFFSLSPSPFLVPSRHFLGV